MPHINEPVDAGLRKRPSKRGGGRHGMDEIAERAEFDQKDFVQEWVAALILESRSRVEWSFGSPTMAMRPP